MRKILKLGTRGSELALSQAYYIKEKLVAAGCTDYIRVVTVTTKGDLDQESRVVDMGGKNVFVKEIEEALLSGRIDCAVNSLKDMSATVPERLMISAYLGGFSRNDVLVSLRGVTITDLPPESRIGTGGPRRQAQLGKYYPRLSAANIRGNVPTRIQKLRDGNYNALILARAGLERLKMTHYISHDLSVEEFVPAAGQGIIAVETLKDNKPLNRLIAKINEEETETLAQIEFEVLRLLGVGCQEPVGIYAAKEGGEIKINYFISKGGKDRELSGAYASDWARRRDISAIVTEEIKSLWKKKYNQELRFDEKKDT